MRLPSDLHDNARSLQNCFNFSPDGKQAGVSFESAKCRCLDSTEFPIEATRLKLFTDFAQKLYQEKLKFKTAELFFYITAVLSL